MSAVWVFGDYAGRRIVGALVNDVDGVAEILDPLLMTEVIKHPQVELQVAPIWHSFETETMYVRWSHKHIAAPKQVSFYQEFVSKVKASRAGIEVATRIPDNVIKLAKS